MNPTNKPSLGVCDGVLYSTLLAYDLVPAMPG
jgi:hypothetical protein